MMEIDVFRSIVGGMSVGRNFYLEASEIGLSAQKYVIGCVNERHRTLGSRIVLKMDTF